MKRLIVIQLFLGIFFGLQAQNQDNNEDEYHWRFNPWIDSINQSNLDSQTFQIFHKGKVGWMDKNYGILCPPRFAKALPPRIYKETYDYDQWFTQVSDGKKWGLYSREHINYVDTQLIIDCAYDSFTMIATEESFKIRAWTKKKYKIYDAITNQWEVPIGNVKTQTFVAPTLAEIPIIDAENMDAPGLQEQDAIGTREARTTRGDPDESYNTSSPYGDDNGSSYKWQDTRGSNGNEPRKKSQGMQIKVVKDSSDYKFGLYSNKADSFIIKPIYKKIETYNNNNYFCYLYKYTNKVQVFDSNGIAVTPVLKEINTHYFAETIVICTTLSGQFLLYNKQMKPLLINSYEKIDLSRGLPLLFLRSKQGINLYDYKKMVLLPETYDSVFTEITVPLIVAQQKNNLIVYNYFENKSIKIKKATFTKYYKDSTLVIRKKNKSYLMNLLSGTVSKTGWDSIHAAAIPYKRSEIPYKIENNLNDIFIIFDNGKMGLADHNNKVLLTPEYDRALAANRDFPGLLTFVKNNLYTLYNAKEYKILVTDIDTFRYVNYSVNLIRSYNKNKIWNTMHGDRYLLSFRVNKKWGILFGADSIYTPAIYDSVVTRNRRVFLAKNHKYHFMIPDFKYKTDFGYDSVWTIEEKYMLLKKEGLYYFMNTSNQFFPEFGTPWISKIKEPYEQNIYIYKQQNLYGLVKATHYQTLALLEDVRHGNNKLLWAKINGKWGIIQK